METPAPTQSTTLPLDQLRPGQRAKIVEWKLDPLQRQRFMEMGLTMGAQLELVRFAPMGDPIDIRIRGYHLSLRKREAAGLLVTLI